MKNNEEKDPLYRQYQIFYGIFVTLYVILNFLGSPLLKWNYLIIVALTIIGVMKYKWQEVIINVFVLFFIEGQGRILLGYNQISKVLFDLVLAIAVLKSAITLKKVIPLKKIPNFFYILITFHFLWYTFQLFNPDAASTISVLGASKIYIFPFFLFFMFLNNPLSEKHLKQIQLSIFIIVLLQVTLSVYQMGLKEGFLIGITPHYANIMKDRFTEQNFRAFGTTYAPGGPGVYIAYFACMLFITNFKTLYVKISYTLITLWSIFGLYLLQVRSALLKFLALISLSIFSRLLVNKGQIKNFIISTVVISLISIAIINVFDFEKFFPDIDFTQASSRILVLQDMDALKSQRISFDKALNIIFQKLDQNPIGLGPGRTGGAVSLAKSVIMKDPVYGIKSTWTFDNLFISLAIDLGWGMIFYLLIITIFPLFLIYKCIYFYFNKQEADITPILLSALTTVVLLAGNWGVIGIPYNPESFSFWFWTSIGITQIYKIENKSEDHV